MSKDVGILCLCHKEKRPDFEFPHMPGESVFCQFDKVVLSKQDIPLNWREGTDTMTEGEKVYWHVHDGEILLDLPVDSNPIYLSRDQAINMITGLAYVVGKLDR